MHTKSDVYETCVYWQTRERGHLREIGGLRRGYMRAQAWRRKYTTSHSCTQPGLALRFFGGAFHEPEFPRPRGD